MASVTTASVAASAASQGMVRALPQGNATTSLLNNVSREGVKNSSSILGNFLKNNYGWVIGVAVVIVVAAVFLTGGGEKKEEHGQGGESLPKENKVNKAKNVPEIDNNIKNENKLDFNGNEQKNIVYTTLEAAKSDALKAVVKKFKQFAEECGIDNIDFLNKVSIKNFVSEKLIGGTSDAFALDDFLVNEEVNEVYRYCLVFASIAVNMKLGDERGKVKSILLRVDKEIICEIERRFGKIKIDEEHKKQLVDLLSEIDIAIKGKYDNNFSTFKKINEEEQLDNNILYYNTVSKQKEYLLKRIGFLKAAFSKSSDNKKDMEEIESINSTE